MPEHRCNRLLLTEEFLNRSMELFSVPSRGLDANPKTFQPKYLNIIDPLKENNNLGRSVHRGQESLLLIFVKLMENIICN